MAATRTSAAGLALITRFEGVVLHYYNDPVGFCTVGVGHLVRRSRCSSGELNTRITMTRALAILREDVKRFERAVRALGVDLNQNEFDALVSIAFNCGEGCLDGTIGRRLKAGDRAGAANAFMLWTKAAGRTLPGLVARRRVEAALFRKPVSGLKGYYTASERRWIGEYDTLARDRRDPHRREVLRRVMTEQRQRVYHEAHLKGNGGWTRANRRARWRSLDARTR